MNRAPAKANAFSLIELLVVIAIIAILISITLPALGSARVSARQALALANGRTIAQTFEQYLGDNDDVYPHVEAAEDPMLPGGGDVRFVRWFPEGTIIGTNDVFILSWAWPALVSSVAPWEENYATWVSPGKDAELPTLDTTADGERLPEEEISWRLSRSFLADPQAFAEDTIEDSRLIRAVRRGDVRHASQKAMLWDAHLAYRTTEPELVDGHWDAPTPIAFADGHGAVHRPQTAKDPVGRRPFPEGPGMSVKMHDTLNGVAGVDFN